MSTRRPNVRVIKPPSTSEQLDRWYRDHADVGVDGWSHEDERRRPSEGGRRVPAKPVDGSGRR